MSTPARSRQVERLLYSPSEAAEALGMGETFFRAEVLPKLPRVDVGTRVLVDVNDLRQWVDDHKDTGCVRQAQKRRSRSASASTAKDASSPRAREIAARLNARQDASTPKLSAVTESGAESEHSSSAQRSRDHG